ncbi:MAG TPA: GNAT family N-acetyltransferase [Candidatus Sulfotelmatobacter sp.]|nr:GNAT family N-acetyltransferase [Candidatus Sulfotelmatobacter sp.]
MHPLDNVIWQALTTRQAQFAEALGGARRFFRDVTLLSAFDDAAENGYGALASLVGADGTTAVFLDKPYEARTEWDFVAGAPLLQMVCKNGTRVRPSEAIEIIELGLPDSSDMLDITTLTKPGPFGPRTHELGNYVGIRDDGKLVAMAGERLKVPGYTEVSAVCTHPEHVGKGYAAVLMMEIMRRIRERRETPFLHVRQDNTRAVALYERLGFKTRKLTHFAVLRRAKQNS